jgi:TonB family protein
MSMRRSRLVAVLILLVCYSALFYAAVKTRAPQSNQDGVPMFSAIVSQIGEERRGGLTSKPGAQVTEDQSAAPASHWTFAPIDIWPSPPGWNATLSEFTPVTEARPDNPANRRARQSTLRMVRWIRPEYPAALASAGEEGCVSLELLIDARGQPIETRVDRSSGWPEIDGSALRAANLWRFSLPLWNSRPIAVGARVEVRYNAGSQTARSDGLGCEP